MKKLALVFGNVIAMVLTVFTLQAMAETTTAGRDFNHTTTGFPLTGVHLAAPCENCHVAGVFKGTAKECDGCHALGKRVVATPKSTSHIVTDGPCETCHFNTSTFLGAKYNHGTAQSGQCLTCHNGRLSTARPASHNTGNKATNSCDQCHRSYAWLPATWNHVGVAPGTCASVGCHVQGSNQYYRGTSHTGYKLSDPACDDCHNYFAWSPAPFKHNNPQPCGNCHNGSIAMGQGPSHLSTLVTCDTCHKSTITWLGATSHSGNIAGQCATCHNGTTAQGKGPTHITTTASCDACHGSNTWLGASNHSGATAGVCGTCHDGVTAKGKNAIASHIPTTGNNCDLCHTSMTNFAVYTMNHSGNGNTTSCIGCHATGSPYPVKTTVTTGSAHHGSTSGQDCALCHKTTTTWAGASSHTGNIAGQCRSCHVALTPQPTSHTIAGVVALSCDACHGQTVWTGAHTSKLSAYCGVCHAADAKSKHGTVTPGSKYYNCGSCHSTSTFNK